MNIKLRFLRNLIKEELNQNSYSLFHITHKNLGKNFTFTPYIPIWTQYCDAEDFTTPRISLSDSIDNAILGKFGSISPNNFGQDEMFVYATNNKQNTIIPQSGQSLSTPNNNWGPDWQYKLYALEHDLDQNNKQLHAKIVQGKIVEKTNDIKEIWSLKPIQMKLIGRLSLNDTRNPTKIIYDEID
jgi:hypothetical protein